MTKNVGTLMYLAPETIDNTLSFEQGDMSRAMLATKLDIYSYGIIMWELLFEMTPFLQNPDESEPTEKLLAYKIPFLVSQGLRPTIPKRMEEDYARWIQGHFLNYAFKGFKNPASVLEKYVILMKLCWEQQPSKRPSFSFILEQLKEMKDL